MSTYPVVGTTAYPSTEKRHGQIHRLLRPAKVHKLGPCPSSRLVEKAKSSTWLEGHARSVSVGRLGNTPASVTFLQRRRENRRSSERMMHPSRRSRWPAWDGQFTLVTPRACF